MECGVSPASKPDIINLHSKCIADCDTAQTQTQTEFHPWLKQMFLSVDELPSRDFLFISD